MQWYNKKECGLEFVVPGKSDGEFNETFAATSNDNATAAASASVNTSTTTGSDDVVDDKHCALVGSGWLWWYPTARPGLGFVVYYVVPMLLIGVLYARVVCKLLTTSAQRHGSGDRERRHAARSTFVSQ